MHPLPSLSSAAKKLFRSQSTASFLVRLTPWFPDNNLQRKSQPVKMCHRSRSQYRIAPIPTASF